jgi:hypothetical protein
MGESYSMLEVREKDENGTRRSVWMPEDLDLVVEKARHKLGLNRSAFYKYALTKLLQDLSLLSEAVHRKEVSKNVG